MTSKRDIQLHLDGIAACKAKNYESALENFLKIPSYAPILFNIASCHLKLKNTKRALETLTECLSRDKYMAIGHFQCGVAQVLLNELSSARESFETSLKLLRGNSYIDYKQQNMPYKLHACEIRYNNALVLLFIGDQDGARVALEASGKGSLSDATRRNFIADGVNAMSAGRLEYFGNGPSLRLLQLPECAFFDVSKSKSEGLKAPTNFMAPARVVAAQHESDDFTGFVGARGAADAGSNRIRRVNGRLVGPPPSVPPPRRPPSPTAAPRDKKPQSPTSPLKLQPTNQDRLGSPKKPATQREVSLSVQVGLNMNVTNNISYDEFIAKLQQALGDFSTSLPNKLERRQINLTVSGQSDINVKSKQDWESAWSATCGSNASNVSVSLKDVTRPSLPPQKTKPSRPAPKLT